MNPALPSVLPWNGTSDTPDGGNLAGAHPVSHFLFPKQLQKLLRQITDTDRLPAVPKMVSAPAASPHGLLPCRVPQALPFREVNYLTHVPVSRCETLFNTEAFA